MAESRPKLLVVVDDQQALDRYENAFEKNFTVIPVFFGNDVLSVARDENPDAVLIDLLPETNAFEWFLAKKRAGNRSVVKNLLSELLPSRFADLFCELHFPSTVPASQLPDKAFEDLSAKLHPRPQAPS